MTRPATPGPSQICSTPDFTADAPATTLVGVVMTAVYLITGALWLAMLLHALIDLNGLVLRPWLSSSSASRS